MSKPDDLTKESSVTWLALFTATGTLVCCAIPIILVSLGLGAVVASMVSSLPFLVTLSEHKIWVFSISGVMLMLSAWMLYRPERTCPTVPKQAELCHKTQLWNRCIYWFSVILWIIGIFAAFIVLPLTIWLEG
ncbi:MAG TPA: hypothetical protein DEO86_06325 [Colwellia sp.]|nr:hypothetical protein [Colwellia sp.]|tara:strand:+ start:10022 stop:10420 length:399 start_codon:yes stop_codon:yes gene_type:complete